jgi:hypothetical protein
MRLERFVVGLLGFVPVVMLMAPPSLVAAGELRTVEGRYVRIVTDLDEDAESRQWTDAVDKAVPQFCQFWEVPLEQLDGWRITACMIREKQTFRTAGLLGADVPDFPHGFQIGNNVWVMGQPSAYYTRHLLIHEAAHAFAFHVFGGAGPPWFMEGTAEYLATHRWDGENLEVGVLPESSSSFPYWGRFKMIDARRRNAQALSLMSVLRYSDTAHRQVEPYAWTWAAVQLFAAYPDTRTVLIAAARNGRESSPQFTKTFVESLGPLWPVAQTRWKVLIDEFDYGYDFGRNRIDLRNEGGEIESLELPWNGRSIRIPIAANRGWQSAGLLVQAGTRFRIDASGEVILAPEPKPWVAKADGITLRYHRGRPLGRLLATILPAQSDRSATTAALPVKSVGEHIDWIAEETGWLMLRVGDDPSEVADNEGEFVVVVDTVE